jgi:hypothetical protein
MSSLDAAIKKNLNGSVFSAPAHLVDDFVIDFLKSDGVCLLAHIYISISLCRFLPFD